MSDEAAPFYELVIGQGTTFKRTFVWKDADGMPILITDFTARLQIRENYASTEVILALSTVDFYPALVITGALGRIELTIPESVTRELDFNGGVWDLEIVSPSPDEEVTRLVQGTARVSKEATK